MSTLALAPDHLVGDLAPPAPAALRAVSDPATRPRDLLAFPGVTDDGENDDDPGAGPRLVRPGAPVPPLPDPATWCGTLVRACAEVLLGARSLTQLTRWLTPPLQTALGHHAGAGALPAGARRVRVLRVHLQQVDETRHEASVVLHDGRRVRAAAVRIEVHRGRWRATALQIG